MNKESMPIEVWKFLPIKKSVIMLILEKKMVLLEITLLAH